MEHALAVRVVESVCHLLHDAADLCKGKATAGGFNILQTLFYRPAVDVFHHKKEAVTLFIEIINLNDISVTQRSSQTGFPFKPGCELRVTGQAGVHHLNSHIASQLLMMPPEYFCHSTRTYPLVDGIFIEKNFL